jgi:hypothetical protein
MKIQIIIVMAFVLLIPVSVNAISVDEFNNLLQEVQTEDDVDILISHLFKNTDYLKTCKDLFVQIHEDYSSSETAEQGWKNNNTFEMLDCPAQQVYWADAPEQYSDSECRTLISEFTNANTISAKLQQEWRVMVQQEKEENELYLEETGFKRQSNKSDKWLEETEYDEMYSLKNSASRDYRLYCSGSLVQGCEEKYNEELRLANLENPTFDDSVQETILGQYRDWLCERDTKLEVWMERQNQLGFTVDATLLDSPKIEEKEKAIPIEKTVDVIQSQEHSDSNSKPTCGSGTIEKNGQCVVDEKEGGGCLIATATYGSEMSQQVQQLRELRDNTLMNARSGVQFMGMFNDVYYSFSPTIADYERENPIFKEMVKVAITPMISSLSILNYVDMDSESEVLGYGISLILLNLGMYLGVPAIVVIGIRKRI